MPGKIRRWAGLLRWGAIAVATVVIAPTLVAVGVLLAASAGTPAPNTGSTGDDALWMGHAWVDGRRDAADIARMAERLRDSGIHDVYVHVGPLDDHGRLSPRLHPRSAWFLREFSQAAPGVRVSVWLGNIVGPGGLDLDDAAIRRNILDAARTMLDQGYDGVHYNFEPVPSGNPGLLRLLDDTHELTSTRGAMLSMATEPTAPFPTAATLAETLRHPLYWQAGYLRAVAARVDQVAIMVYDSGMPLKSLYGGYVVRQTTRALRTIPPDTSLLIGAPAYPDDSLFYRPYAETVAGTARAVRLALSEHPGRRTVGIALYVDFAATKGDWSQYFHHWANSSTSALRPTRTG